MMRLFILLLLICLNTTIFGQDSLIWDFTTNGRIFSSPVVDENSIYIGSNDSCLYALDKKSGVLRFKFKSNGEIKSKPLLFNNTIIFNSSDGLIYSIDKKTEQIVWTFETEGEKCVDIWDYYLSSPIVSNDRLFIGSGDSNIYAIDPITGEQIWKFKTDGVVHSTPLVYNEMVLIGSFDGNFYALNAQTGDMIWKFKTVGDAYFPLGAIQNGATLYNNSVIFGSRDFNIYCLNIETGRGMWNMKEKGSWIIAKPLIYDNLVYFGTSDSHRFCGLDAKNGEEKLTFPLNMRVYAEAIVYHDDVYFGCFNGKLYRINHLNKNLQEVFQTYGSKANYHKVFNKEDAFLEGFELYGKDLKTSEKMILDLGALLSTPIIDDGIIYFGDANGIVYAHQLINNKH